ncbi:MAG TPA: GxxExxY protein [Anaerolineae bacterium]|jgi:GxxExxY protein
MMPLDSKIPHGEVTYDTIGVAMRVHSRLGPGLKEKHYQRALIAEIRKEGRTAEEEYFVELWDGQAWLGRLYLDVLVDSVVVVECKAFSHLLTNEEVAQLICYLAATGLTVGLLINFGRRRLEYKRILPPKVLQGWQSRVGRFLWRPKQMGPLPEIASPDKIRVVKP